jgi:protein tyrosine phosphatase
MVWEQNCKVIIMVTNLRERGREQCVKYWPDEGDIMSFRSLEIRQTESMYHADYTVSKEKLYIIICIQNFY